MELTANELMGLVHAGENPKIKFTEKANEVDWRWEKGMIGYVIDAEYKNGDFRFLVDEKEYADYNKKLESAIWFGKDETESTFSNSSYCHDWTGADIVIEGSVIEFFEILEKGRTSLFDEYLATKSTDSYQAWLESEVLKARKRN